MWEDDEVWYSHSVKREFTILPFLGSRSLVVGKKGNWNEKNSAGKQLTSAISDWIEKPSNCGVQRDECISLAEKIVSSVASQGFSHRWCDCLNFQWGKWQSPPLSKPIYGRLLGEKPIHIKRPFIPRKYQCPLSGQLHCKESFSS